MFRSLPLSVAAAAWFLLSASPAHAQTPRPPYIPPDAKGFRIQQMMQAWRQAVRSGPVPVVRSVPRQPVTPAPEPANVQIAITVPNTAGVTPATVAIRGPEGEVRTFPVEGGREALQSRVIVVRPGQTVTIQFRPVK